MYDVACLCLCWCLCYDVEYMCAFGVCGILCVCVIFDYGSDGGVSVCVCAHIVVCGCKSVCVCLEAKTDDIRCLSLILPFLV